MPEYQVDVTGPDGTKTSLTVTTPENGSKSGSSVAAAAIAVNHSANTAARNNTVQTNKTQTGTEVKQQVAAANEVAAVNEAAGTVAPTAATTSKAPKAPKTPRPKSASKSAQKQQNSAAQAKAISAATPTVTPEVKTLELNELNNTIDALLTSYKFDPKDSAHIAVKRLKKAISQMKSQDDIDLINTKLGHIISQHNEGPNKIVYESLLSNLTKMGNNTEFPNLLEELKTVSLSNQLGGRSIRRKIGITRKQRKQRKQRTQRKQRK